MTTPTQRTLAHAREIGFQVQVVERWCAYSRKRIDLFGVIDIVACRDGVGVIGIQACAGGSHAARRKKSMAEPRLAVWLASGGRFELWSWAKQGARGKRKVWTLRREELVLVGGEVVSKL